MAALPRTPIAVIGIGCRFPAAHGPREFWRMLCEGHDAIGSPPSGRFDGSLWTGSTGQPADAGFLSDVDKFDPDFFGISHREARRMDPQLRLLLEVTWEALEDAGQRPRDTEGSRTGVFIGQIASDYWELHSGNAAIDRYAGLSNIRGMLSGRLSHVFDWSGPSVSVDTACSSSLTAVRMACQSLYAGESTVAIAGGVSLMLVRKDYPWLFTAGVLARDGRCKFGDATADGYGRGEGVGVVVLKPFDRAIADGDRVYAVIRGSAINNDGRASGFAARPAVRGQSDVLGAALEDAGVRPAEIEYVEAHGTGTAVGDAVEIEALAAVLGEGRSRDEPLRVGSVKTNIGHAEGAAGIAGLIKAGLCLYHGMVPPSLHLHEPNPAVRWDELPLKVQTELEPLPSRAGPRLAGVSSFGVSGTNVHAVLAEAEQPSVAPSEGSHLLTLSARTPQGLRDLAAAYTGYLSAEGREFPLRDICYSASARRQHHASRLAVAGSSHEELTAKLQSFVDGKAPRDLWFSDEIPEVPPGVVFVFPGQGSQWFGMGLQLLAASPVFRTALEECDRAVRKESGWSVIERLAVDDEPSHDVDVVQPLLFSIQVGIAAVWRSWGVEPELVIGHSMGEVAAAHVAGALSLQDAVAVICRRSKLAAQVAGWGAMASIALPMAETAEALAGYQDKVSIAASNSLSTTLISGDPSAVDEIVATVEDRDVFCRKIDVPFAAHSPQVDGLRDELLRSLAELRPQAGSIPIHSTVLDTCVDGSSFDADYWVRNFREPVRFASAVRAVPGSVVFVEISPHPVLLPAIEESLQSGRAVGSLRREKPELPALLTSMGALYTEGCQIDWNRLYGGEARLVSLPSYPWEHGSYWIRTSEPTHPLLGRPVAAPAPERVWEGRLDRTRNRYLDGHRIQGVVTFPGAGYCELAFAAARDALGDGHIALEDAGFQQLLLLGDQESPVLRVRMVPEQDSAWRIEIHSGKPDSPQRTVQHASFRARVLPGTHHETGEPLAAVRARCPEHLSGQHFYARFAKGDNQWQGPFRGVAEVWRGNGEALTRVSCPDPFTDGFFFHPAMLDACGHSLLATTDPVAQAFAIDGFDSAQVWGQPQRELWSHARLTAHDSGTLTGDIRIMQPDGSPIAEVRGARLRYLTEPPPQRQDYDDWLYELKWERSELLPGERELTPGTWIILGDGMGVGHGLRRLIEDAGGHCVTVVPAGSTEIGDFVLDPGEPEGFRKVLRTVPLPVQGIVHLWSLDIPLGASSEEDAKHAELLTCTSTVRLIQDLTATTEAGTPALWLVTRHAQPVAAGDTAVSPLSALLWGFGRVLAQENPELCPTLVDVEVPGAEWAAEALFNELTVRDRETERVLRCGGRFVPRMRRYTANPVPAVPNCPYRVRHGAPGLLDEFTVERAKRRKPGAGEVEIETAFAGLNYADVLGVMGLVPEMDAQDRVPGAECAGKITALGTMTHGLQVGDEVVAVGNLGLGSHVIAQAPLVWKRPVSLDLADAATVPIAYLTAYHSLHELAALRRGERVLIHTATGGVGLAAIQIARMLGAEIFATAGSREKRALLRAMGIKHVADSRSLDFADEFVAATYGKGVDVVLNTLSGPAIAKNLELLAPYGRYVELTKKDVFSDGQIAMRQLARNISFHVVDVMDMWQSQPARVSAVLREVFSHIDAGVLAPLPAHTFTSERVGNAFRHFAQSKQIGKVLVSFEQSTLVRADATYLVTGGLGGIGAEVARWLVAQGAQHLLLVGRSELPPRSAWPGLDPACVMHRRVTALEMLEQTGIQVRYEAVDVADEAALRSVLAEVEHPVRGVFHTAGIADWGLAGQFDDERLATVLRPKVEGSLVLDRIFEDVDMFVLFSSIASLMSSPLLAAYSAANNFLDALTHQRRRRGAPATGINWGFWDSIGMAAGVDEKAKVIPKGFKHFSPADGIAVMERLIRADADQVAVLVADWAEWSAVHHHFAQLPLLDGLVPAAAHQPVARADEDAVRKYLIDRIAEALEVPPEHVNTRQPLNRLGLDSLAAVELKNLASRDLGVDLPVVMLLGGFTLDDLVGQLSSA